MHASKAQGDSAGLRFQGSVSKDTVVVVTNDTADNSGTVRRAEDLGVRVSSLEQFALQVSRMTLNGRIIFPKFRGTFADLPISGKKIYPVDLSQSDLDRLEKVLIRRGASLAQQIRPSLGVAICDLKSADSGACKILESEGIPVFDISEI